MENQNTQTVNSVEQKHSKQTVIFAVLAIIVLAVIAFTIQWFANNYNSKPTVKKTTASDTSSSNINELPVEKNSNAPSAAQQSKNDNARITAAVGKLTELPKDETPTLATVSDPSQLKGQPFFNGARAGDRLLIYSQSKKAILYREDENKIINVGPAPLLGN